MDIKDHSFQGVPARWVLLKSSSLQWRQFSQAPRHLETLLPSRNADDSGYITQYSMIFSQFVCYRSTTARRPFLPRGKADIIISEWAEVMKY